MTRFPPPWRQTFGANVITASRDGAYATLQQRLRPQPSVSAVVEATVAADRTFVMLDGGEMKRVVTLEGEYAAHVVVHGRRGTAPAIHVIGAVLAGDVATALDIRGDDPAQFAELAALGLDLVRGQRLELGRRPRPFFYMPPPGWSGLPDGLGATWYPPGFPARRAMIAVPPARPGAEVEAAIAELGAALSSIEEQHRAPLRSEGGVDGVYARVRGRRDGTPVWRELAVFAVDDWTYRVRLDSEVEPGALGEVCRAVATSFEPLPGREEAQTGRPFAARLDLFDHWAG